MSSKVMCDICGSPMYITDQGAFEYTYHCSSDDARFWEFDRGSKDQQKSKDHWDKSKKDIDREINLN